MESVAKESIETACQATSNAMLGLKWPFLECLCLGEGTKERKRENLEENQILFGSHYVSQNIVSGLENALTMIVYTQFVVISLDSFSWIRQIHLFF